MTSTFRRFPILKIRISFMYISNPKMYMFHLPLFLDPSTRYMLVFWNTRLCSGCFYAHLGEPHCSISSISQLWWRWRIRQAACTPGRDTAADFTVFGCYVSLHFSTTSFPYLQLFICIRKARSSELQKNITFGIKTHMSDAICFWSGILLYLKWWNNSTCAASDDLFINLFLVYYFLEEHAFRFGGRFITAPTRQITANGKKTTKTQICCIFLSSPLAKLFCQPWIVSESNI